jgi:Zn finger protein HypA/HybF involved in hydrogenase expression
MTIEYIMENKIYKLSDEQFVELLKKSSTISEVLFKLGYVVKGNSWGYSQVKRRMDDLGLDYSILKGKSAAMKTNKLNAIRKEDILKENCKHQRTVLRRYVIKNNLIPYKCAICGCTEWQGRTLSLEIDHVNGINDDNRLENLRFLCPNCHSQTSTYGSRNQQLNSSEYDIPDDLRKMVEEKYNDVKSVKKVSSILGIRRCVVTKIVNESGQKHSNQKYIIRYDKDWNELARYGSLVEAAKALINANEVKTKRVKTCTRTITHNKNNFWLNSHWKILDGSGIINNPLLEPSLIDSEDTVDEAQAKAA